MRMGIPRILTSDNGKEFKNNLDDDLSKKLGIKRIFTTPYHPQVIFILKYVNYVCACMGPIHTSGRNYGPCSLLLRHCCI